MQNVPKIVQARLQRVAAQAKTHPDADLLTAFAERSLSESERSRVMDHLACCGDCREVVALAVPAAEAATIPGNIRSARRPWVGWAGLRWGVVAAGIVLIGSVGMLRYKHSTEQKTAVVSIPVRQEEKINTTLQNPQASAEVLN